MAAQQTSESPQFFALRLTSGETTRYIICEAILTVNGGKLPKEVKRWIEKEFQDSLKKFKPPIEAIPLPPPGPGQAYSLQSTMLSVQSTVKP